VTCEEISPTGNRCDKTRGHRGQHHATIEEGAEWESWGSRPKSTTVVHRPRDVFFICPGCGAVREGPLPTDLLTLCAQCDPPFAMEAVYAEDQ
jgi:hypothetical protein